MSHGIGSNLRRFAVRAALGVGAAVCTVPGAVVAADSGDGIAVTGGRWYTLEQAEPQDNLTALIRNGHIEALGENINIPFSYQQVDVAGRIVTPGFIESYSQLGIQEIEAEVVTVDHSVLLHPLGPGFDVQYAINPASSLFAVNRVEGVTRAVVAPKPGNDPLAGWGAVVQLTDRSPVLDTRVAQFGSWTAENSVFVGSSKSAVIQRMRRALILAKRFQPNRYEEGSGDYPAADMASLKELLSRKAPLVLDVNRAADIREAVKLASEHNLPLIILHGVEAWQEAQLLAQNNVTVIVDPLANLPIDFESLGARLDNAALLHRAGVRVLLTSEETQNARWLRQVAGNAVAHGMPWHAALAAVTRAPADAWGMKDGAGRLREGGVADLVVWSGDPFEVTTWAERVMIGGRWMPADSRQTRLFERYSDLSGDKPFQYR